MLTVEELQNVITNILFEEEGSYLHHRDFIFVGNNMSGKTYLLKKLLSEYNDKMYFIDTMNRTIATSNPMYSFSMINDVKDILNERLVDENFNVRDSISRDFSNALILNELIGEGSSVYNDIISRFFDIDFKVFEIKEEGDVFGNTIFKYKLGASIFESLSNGVQAIIRILVEIIYARTQDMHIIVIDEIDLHLDNEHCKRIVSFLKQEFPDVKWLLTTHSADLILSCQDFNLIKIDGNNCFCFDGNDMDSLPYISRMLFEPNTLLNREITVKLGEFLRLKLQGIELTKENIEEINAYADLTVREEVLKEFILR